MTYEQIAEPVDCSTSTVHRHYAAALKALPGQFDHENAHQIRGSSQREAPPPKSA